MRIHVLGDLEVTVDGRQVDLGGAKPRTLVGLLVAAEGRAVAIEQLIEEMWEGEPPARVEASLQTYVARLRRALDPGRTDRIRTHPGGYSLRQDDVEVDAVVFAAEVEAARALTTTDPRRAADALTAALARWRGEAYAGLGSAGLRAESVRLAELRFAATENLWQLRTDLGDHAEAVGALERLVAEQPLRERLWALLARALYRAARQGDALAALRRARDHLAEELGIDPGPELQALEQAILRQDPLLAPATPAPATAAAPPAPAPVVEATSIFGRDAALATADHLLSSVVETRRGRVLVVEGESGIGKTRFADEVADRARRSGTTTGRGVWESDPCPPLWGWSRALGHAGVDPGVLVVPDGHDAASVSFQQAEQVLAALGARGPVLLVLDDVQWADAESLRLLRRLASGIAEVPVLLLVLVRREATVGADLAGAVAALTRVGAERLELSGLDPVAVHEWVRRRAGVEVGEEVAAGLIERTEGNPFYLGELVRLLASGGALTGAGGLASVPSSVRDVVRQRLAAIGPGYDDVVTAAAVAGRSFDLGVVAEASGRALADVEEATEALQVLGLVDEEGPGRYRFAHAIARDAVYEMLSGVARSRAHATVGAALEARWSTTLGDHVAELARHYELAGPGYERSAWLFAHRAAQQAFEQASYDEALRQAQRSAALQCHDPALDPVEREDVLVLVVRSLLRLGRPLDAWEPVALATRSALDRGDTTQAARVLVTISEGIVWGWRAHPYWSEEGIALWREVLEAATEVDPGTAALLRAGLPYELFFRPADEPLATEHAERAIREARQEAVPERMRMHVLKLAVPALLRPETRARRMPLYDEIIALAARLDDHATLAATLTHRAHDHGAGGRLESMRGDSERARALAVRHRLPEAMLVSGLQVALEHQMRGDWEKALAVVAEVEELESTLAMSARGITLAHRAMIREDQGRLAEMEEHLARVREWHPVFRELHALALVRCGREQEVRELMGSWADQPFVHRDYFTVALNALRARTWAALADQEAIAALREALAQHADELAIASGVIFLGSVEQTLGELAAAAGDRAAAETHLLVALARHEELGLDHWVHRSRTALDALA